MKHSWQSYEEVAAYLLHKYAEEFGLEFVEGKQEVEGKRSGTTWEIDAKGIKEGGEGFVIIEARKYSKSRQNQEKLGGLAYRILDTGAEGGILVSPLGFQSGAKKVANAENIIEVHLDANSTPNEYFMGFLNNLMVGLHECITATDCVKVTISRACNKCGKYFVAQQNENVCLECLQSD